tara:strand:- start:6706 stop:6861 length:156 start_codon:yes stop_codon:yes gene_type:complete
VAQMLLGLIEKMNQTLSTHTHNSPLPTPIEKAELMSYQSEEKAEKQTRADS